MAKISPVSIKYMIHANFSAEGALEKPDIIGAIFGQTEGLLGADLEMRELQKEGKIGRIEVDLERSDKRTTGIIKVPTALDQSETTLIAAAMETIERIGPCDAQIEVERIEDVRKNKRDFIIERAKKLMQNIEGSTDSREISNQIKDSARMAEINEYGESKLPCGDLSEKELIVVEGRADVLNLLKNGVKNVIAMNGTKLPDEIKKLGREKDIVLFVDGDRGGKLIAQNVVDNANVKFIAVAPEGKEVEELTGKEILMQLRRRVLPREFFYAYDRKGDRNNDSAKDKTSDEAPQKKFELDGDKKEKIRELAKGNQDTKQALILNEALEEIDQISVRALLGYLKKAGDKATVLIVDGLVTPQTIKAAEDAHVKVIAGNNFSATSENIELLSI